MKAGKQIGARLKPEDLGSPGRAAEYRKSRSVLHRAGSFSTARLTSAAIGRRFNEFTNMMPDDAGPRATEVRAGRPICIHIYGKIVGNENAGLDALKNLPQIGVFQG